MANATCQARAVLPVPRPTPSNTRFPVMTLTNTLPSARKPIASSDPVPIARATVRMFRTAAARRQRSANALNAAMAAELAGHRRRAALTEPGVVTLAARMRAAVPAEDVKAPACGYRALADVCLAERLRVGVPGNARTGLAPGHRDTQLISDDGSFGGRYPPGKRRGPAPGGAAVTAGYIGPAASDPRHLHGTWPGRQPELPGRRPAIAVWQAVAA